MDINGITPIANSSSFWKKTQCQTGVYSTVSQTQPLFPSLPLRQRPSSASNLAIVSFKTLFFSFSFSNFFFHCSAVNSKLTEAVFLIVLALHQRRLKWKILVTRPQCGHLHHSPHLLHQWTGMPDCSLFSVYCLPMSEVGPAPNTDGLNYSNILLAESTY